MDRRSEIRKLVEQGRFQEGLEAIKNIPQQSLTISELLLKTEILRELGSLEEAFTLHDSISDYIKNDEQFLQYKVEEAYLLYRNTKIYSAIQILENLQDKFNSFSEIYSYEAKIAFIKSYSLLGNLEWRAHNLTNMVRNYETAFELSQQLHHGYSMIHSLIGLGNASKEQGDPVSAIAFYESALFASIQVNNLKFEAYCRNNLGEIYILLGRIDEALHELELANQYFSDEGSTGPLSITSFNLGLCHYFNGRLKIAEQYFKFSLMLSEKTNYSFQLIDVFLFLILIKSSFDDYMELELVYHQFLRLLKKQDSEQYYGIKMLIDGIILFNTLTLRSRVKALEIFEQLMKIEIKIKYKLLAMTYLLEIKFDEYRMYGQEEELQEISYYFDHLQDLSGVGIHFELRFLMLQAKFEEIKDNSDEAILILGKGLQLCKKYGLFTEKYEILECIQKIKMRRKDQRNPMEVNQESIDHYLDLLRKNFNC